MWSTKTISRAVAYSISSQNCVRCASYVKWDDGLPLTLGGLWNWEPRGLEDIAMGIPLVFEGIITEDEDVDARGVGESCAGPRDMAPDPLRPECDRSEAGGG